MSNSEHREPAVAGADGAAVAARALAAVNREITRLREIEWWYCTGEDVLQVAAALESATRALFGVQMRLAGEIDQQCTAAVMGARSTAALLSQTLRITVGEARTRLAAAGVALPREAVSGAEVEPALPRLVEVIDDGEISPHHSRIITDTVEKIPDAVDEQTRSACHELLVNEAQQRDPNGLRKVAEQIRLICDPDGSLPKPDPAERAELHIGALRHDGLTAIRGLLDPLTMQQLRSAVGHLSRPQPIDENTPDPRPAPVRRAQALSEVLRRYLMMSGGPSEGGHRPQVGVTISADTLTRHGANAARGDAGSDDLARSLLPGGQFDDGTPAHLRVSQMLACDGDLIPVLLGADSAVLDQGRAVRLFTRPQRRALVARDKGCAFPGCDSPAAWCEAHHITYWSHGGPTDLANGVLLCRRHHTVIHQERWTILPAEIPRGRPYFIPPKHIDPQRTPRRNNYFHLPQMLATTTIRQ